MSFINVEVCQTYTGFRDVTVIAYVPSGCHRDYFSILVYRACLTESCITKSVMILAANIPLIQKNISSVLLDTPSRAPKIEYS